MPLARQEQRDLALALRLQAKEDQHAALYTSRDAALARALQAEERFDCTGGDEELARVLQAEESRKRPRDEEEEEAPALRHRAPLLQGPPALVVQRRGDEELARALQAEENGKRQHEEEEAPALPHRAPQLQGLRSLAIQPHDRVGILRLRKEALASPIVLVKNFMKDRGLALSLVSELERWVRDAPDARAATYSNPNVRTALDSHSKSAVATAAVQRAADEVMRLCEQAVERQDPGAATALRQHWGWSSTAALVYEQGAKLPRHVDNCGTWVVLFSFGCTVDFFCGGRTVAFESGDALVFNGAKQHAVKHGFQGIRKHATLHGRKSPMPEEMGYLQTVRASYQVRMADEPVVAV